MKIYRLQTQDQRPLNKTLEGCLQTDAIFKPLYPDTALNQLIELHANNMAVRAKRMKSETYSKGKSILAPQRNSHSSADTHGSLTA